MPQGRSLKTQDSATAILQQQYSRPTNRKPGDGRQGEQVPMPNEIMINTDYDNDRAMNNNQKDNYDG